MLENPRVVGVKNSSLPTHDIQLWKQTGGERFVVLNGPDEQFITGLAMGASGGIGGTYAVMPELFLRAYPLMEEGNVSQARKVQNLICRIIGKMCSTHGSMYAVAKEILRKKGVDAGSARLPLPPLAESDIAIAEEVCQMIDAAIAETER